ncbi:MAG: RusA family crossover junction endodeoxyribonuclease [Alphaproteobacteria bacterium]
MEPATKEHRLAGEQTTNEDDASRPWTRSGKVRARLDGAGALEVQVDGLTTQAKYYKPLLREFFRKDFAVRPRWGDFSAHIVMQFTGDPPHMDLDNLAKALLDSATGAAFHDDSQVARLLVERRREEREGIWMRFALIEPLQATRTG